MNKKTITLLITIIATGSMVQAFRRAAPVRTVVVANAIADSNESRPAAYYESKDKEKQRNLISKELKALEKKINKNKKELSKLENNKNLVGPETEKKKQEYRALVEKDIETSTRLSQKRIEISMS